MRPAVTSMLEVSLFFIIFSSASWLAYNLQTDGRRAIESIYVTTEDQHRAVNSSRISVPPNGFTYQGNEILFMLRDVEEGLLYIEVDGVSFTPGLDPEETNVSIIELAARYEGEATYNDSGQVTRMQFRKVR